MNDNGEIKNGEINEDEMPGINFEIRAESRMHGPEGELVPVIQLRVSMTPNALLIAEADYRSLWQRVLAQALDEQIMGYYESPGSEKSRADYLAQVKAANPPSLVGPILGAS